MLWLILLLVVAAVIVGVVLARKSRSTALRERFGAEYERAVEEHGDRRKAEAGLRAVAKRRVELDIQPLGTASRDRYVLRWRDAQARFVDAPVRAVAEADSLVGQVLRERGYPTGDFDEQVAMLAADHGDRADAYRRAHAIHRGSEGDGDTDALREAFLSYRVVFNALVGDAAEPTAEAVDDDEARRNPPSWDGAPYDGQDAEDQRRVEQNRRAEVERRVSTARSTTSTEEPGR